MNYKLEKKFCDRWESEEILHKGGFYEIPLGCKFEENIIGTIFILELRIKF
jgi:hypothetical protein